MPVSGEGAAMTLTAQQLFDREFSRPRTKRSQEFKAGVLSLLRRRIHGIATQCPYTEATAAFDAFFSGIRAERFPQRGPK